MEKLTGNDKLQRVTVFLNPFAHRRGILDKFDEDAMPLLQISGLDVQMVYLDDDDEAKKYADVLDPTSTDAIIVAGDDNLLAKVKMKDGNQFISLDNHWASAQKRLYSELLITLEMLL